MCRFSGLRVYPGHGMKMARTDGQVFLFLNAKCKRLYNQKKKPSKLAWTALFRKAHKKVRRGGSHRTACLLLLTMARHSHILLCTQDQSAETARKKKRSTRTAAHRAIVGVSLEVRRVILVMSANGCRRSGRRVTRPHAAFAGDPEAPR